MEAQAEKFIDELGAAEFAPDVFERLFERIVHELTHEAKGDLLKRLQEEATAPENEVDKERCARIHLCLCRIWELVRDCSRKRGILDTQLYEAQLPQVWTLTGAIFAASISMYV